MAGFQERHDAIGCWPMFQTGWTRVSTRMSRVLSSSASQGPRFFCRPGWACSDDSLWSRSAAVHLSLGPAASGRQRGSRETPSRERAPCMKRRDSPNERSGLASCLMLLRVLWSGSPDTKTSGSFHDGSVTAAQRWLR